MAIRMRAEVTGTFQGATEVIQLQHNARTRWASQKAYETIKPELEQDFAATPSPSVHPFVWSYDDEANARAARWWFGAIARGEVPTDGNRYRRSGKLGKSFEILFTAARNIAKLIVRNRARDDKGRFKYRWVVGTFDKARGSNWQIPGHKRTGWWLVRPTVEDRLVQFRDTVEKLYKSVRTNIVAGNR